MRLVEACEPLFQYVCALTRAAAKGAPMKAEVVQKKVKAVFEEIRESCAGSQTLARQFEQVELPLIFFVDFLIAESKSRFARDWQPLAFERDELAGDDKFFKMLDETLGESSSDADERLAVFHTCLGLGFTGIYAVGDDGPEKLKNIRREVARRVLGDSADPGAAKLSPAAYENVDTSNLIESTGRRIWIMLALLVGLVGVLVVANFFQFRWVSQTMANSIDTILAGTSSEQAPDDAAKEAS